MHSIGATVLYLLSARGILISCIFEELFMNDEERKISAKKLRELIEKMHEELVSKSVDIGKLRKETHEELEIVRAEKAAKKATKH